MTDTTATAGRPLTDVTWDEFRRTPLTGQARLGWEAQSDLGHELAAATHLTVDQARTLVSMTTAGLPVVLEWTTELYDLGCTEITRATVLVDHIIPPSATHPDSVRGSVRVRYPGFGHPISLDRITDVTCAETTRTYRDH